MYFIKINKTIRNKELEHDAIHLFFTRGSITPALRKISEARDREKKMVKDKKTVISYQLIDVLEIKDSIPNDVLEDLGAIEV